MASKTEAAYLVLLEAGRPLHVQEITDLALKRKLIVTNGKTPAATLATDLYHENRRRSERGEPNRFVQTGPATWGLVEWRGRSPKKKG